MLLIKWHTKKVSSFEDTTEVLRLLEPTVAYNIQNPTNFNINLPSQVSIESKKFSISELIKI